MKDLRLEKAENALAGELRKARIPASIEIAVMARFGRVQRHRRATIGIGIAAGFVAALAGGIVIGQHRTRITPVAIEKARPALVVPAKKAPARFRQVLVAQPRPRKPERKPAERSVNTETFVAIPYTLPLDSTEDAQVVRMSLPVSALGAAGLPVLTPEQDALAEAEVLVGEDGRPQAVRILAISTDERGFK